MQRVRDARVGPQGKLFGAMLRCAGRVSVCLLVLLSSEADASYLRHRKSHVVSVDSCRDVKTAGNPARPEEFSL